MEPRLNKSMLCWLSRPITLTERSKHLTVAHKSADSAHTSGTGREMHVGEPTCKQKTLHAGS